MLRNVTLTLLLFIAICGSAVAQTGAIKGKVIDKATNEPLPFASVVAEQGGAQVGGAQTDFDGNFTIKPLNPGKYNIKATFVGYQTAQVNDVVVSIDKITFQDIKVGKGAVDITQIDIVDYKVPLIDKGNPATQTTISAEEIKAIPTRDVKSVAATAAGAYQRDEGDDINIRGSRDNATDYYIDGVRVRGSAQVPQSSIEQVTVVTGGVPAQYGDATGGIVSITSKGPSEKIGGGVEFLTSEFLDGYGYNLGSVSLSGPILKKDDNGKKRTILGFFAAGEVQLDKDFDPSAIGFYKVNDDKLAEIKKNPQILTNTGAGISSVRVGEYIRASEIENQKFKENNKNTAYTANMNLDFQPVKNINLKVGGSYSYSKRSDYQYDYGLYNSDNQPEFLRDAYRVFARFTQRFGNSTDKDSKSLFKNTFYSIQFDYNKSKTTEQSPIYEDNLFNYGYLGTFRQVRRANGVQPLPSPVDFNGNTYNIFQGGYSDSYVIYTPAGNNPDLENYTIQMLNFVEPGYFDEGHVYTNTNFYTNLNTISGNSGVVNGGTPRNIYAMWRSPGSVFNRYRIFDNDQLRATLQFSTDIKNHNIVLGLETEQTVERGYGIGPIGLWNTMRNSANSKLSEGVLGPNSYVLGDTLYFPDNAYVPTPLDGKGFYENIRDKLGLAYTDYVDILSYKPETFDMNLFSPDEFQTLGFAFGYDQSGKRMKAGSSSDFYKYFSDKDENGTFKRVVPAWSPTYGALYIQDNFAINDLIFNIGLRIDRFDANQAVMKDKYLLYPARTAGEIASQYNFQVPDNIGDDYVVYVSNEKSPGVNNIIGFRNGDDWYDQNGNPIADPKILTYSSGGTIKPWLLESDPSTRIKINDKEGRFDVERAKRTFEDYTPQITVMPRVAFQFDITDQAQFFANYSVLTQRPPRVWRGDPDNYLQLESGSATALAFSNPDLKPERTTNYELGFRQILSRSSVLSVSAFYRELKQMIQQREVLYAHPVNYATFDNIDFGTIKGMTLTYDLRRTGNIRMSASYTLQFADGTGSGDAAAADLVNTSQPNLRFVAPLDYDQRHSFLLSFDYRYDEGKDYNGPVWFGKQVFANAGVNFDFRAGSGTPFTRQYFAVNLADNIGLQQAGTSKIKGGLNSARLPWQFRVDMRVDKDFKLNMGAKREDKRDLYLNVSLTIQNLLDADNIISVYRYTGTADDDGYLTSAEGIEDVEGKTDPIAYAELYRLKINKPDNYSIPRRIRLGVALNF